jgi:hypothetical protein
MPLAPVYHPRITLASCFIIGNWEAGFSQGCRDIQQTCSEQRSDYSKEIAP